METFFVFFIFAIVIGIFGIYSNLQRIINILEDFYKDKEK